MQNQLVLLIVGLLIVYVIIEEVKPNGKKYIRYNLFERWQTQ